MATETTMSGFTNDWQGERTLSECNMYMMKNSDTCDVRFLVGQTEETVQAHSYILISRSYVFHSMLSGQWTKEDAIKIPDASKDFFIEFLTFLYTDDCSLTAENVTGLLYLSKKYAVHRLSRLCLSFLKTNLTPENACVVLEQAHLFDEDKLFQDALKIIQKNVKVILETPGFSQICQSCLNKILMLSDLDFHIKPEVVLNCVLSWASAECSRQGKEVTPKNQRHVLGESVYLIGFTGFTAADFVQSVVQLNILDDSECLKILSHIACPDVDVGHFRIVDIKHRPGTAILSTVEMYDQSSLPTKDDITLFTNKYVIDALNVTCDEESVMHSITVPPSEAEYEVTVKQGNNKLLNEKCTTTLMNGKLNLSCVKMMPGLSYYLEVKHVEGECPVNLMEVVKDSVSFRGKTFSVSRNTSASKHMRGLIMELTVS